MPQVNHPVKVSPGPELVLRDESGKWPGVVLPPTAPVWVACTRPLVLLTLRLPVPFPGPDRRLVHGPVWSVISVPVLMAVLLSALGQSVNPLSAESRNSTNLIYLLDAVPPQNRVK